MHHQYGAGAQVPGPHGFMESDRRMMQAHALLGIGGAHADRIGQVRVHSGAGVSDPGVMREWVGGCLANALREAHARGVSPCGIISARGGDSAGAAVESALAEAGLADHSAVFLDRRTPTYTAIMAPSGEVLAALADMELYETGLARHLRRAEPRRMIGRAGLVLLDANLPPAAIAQVARTAARPPLALAVSPAKAGRLAASGARFSLVFMNAREWRSLSGTDAVPLPDAPALRRAGLDRAVITQGAAGARLVFDGAVIDRPAPAPVQPVVDVTGAGDALAGAMIAALMRTEMEPDRWTLDAAIAALETGLVAAAGAITRPGPWSPPAN